MTVYIIEKITYDDVIRHGIFLSEKSAKKKLKALFNQEKNDTLHTPEWIDHRSFGLYDKNDSFEYGRFEINEAHVEP